MVLSFSYTTPFQGRTKHIHVPLQKSSIIIGVSNQEEQDGSQSEITINDETFVLAKAYRKTMVREDALESEIVYSDIRRIIIFGHSLNRQDYDSFYALFDAVRLDVDSTPERLQVFLNIH